MRFNLVSRIPGVGEQLARWVQVCLVPHMQRDDVAALADTRGKAARKPDVHET
jgi:hypothetical protein